MHDALTIGIPLIFISAGILFNRADIRDLRADFRAELRGEIGSLRNEMNAGFRVIDADLKFFYQVFGKLEARVEALERRLPQ